MDFLLKKETRVPIIDSCDVLVAGGGIAGISAALSAARQGVRVILSEQEWMLGGLATAGLVTVFLPLCDGMGTQHVFGIGEELLRLSIKYGAEDRYPDAWLDGDDVEKRKKQRFQVQFNPQLFAVAAEQLLLENNVKILYGTKVLDLDQQDNRIQAVYINNREGTSAIRVKSVIDCTGDAEICLMAGEDLRIYDRNFASLWCYFSAYRESGKGYSIYAENYPQSAPIDGTKAAQLNEMMFFLHKMLLDRTLRQREKNQNDRIMPVTMQSIPPIRMTRGLIGAYSLDESEERKTFKDSIGRTTDWRKPGPVFSVPYRCLYGKTANLLTAGRNISVTEAMWDITRCIPTCCVTGEAAGIAAAMAAAQYKAVFEIDLQTLQEHLRSNRVPID